MTPPHDTLGVEILPGDTIRVVSYGWAARVADTGRTTTVTGFTRAGNITHDTPGVANGKALNPRCVGVTRRDGNPGFEGNAR
jgi:hypothetical protein